MECKINKNVESNSSAAGALRFIQTQSLSLFTPIHYLTASRSPLVLMICTFSCFSSPIPLPILPFLPWIPWEVSLLFDKREPQSVLIDKCLLGEQELRICAMKRPGDSHVE